jgi:hypothetical protein
MIMLIDSFPFPQVFELIVLIGNSESLRLDGRPPQRIKNEDE